jgi:hypothetical protein
MGWHGESREATQGSHIMVRFYTENRAFVTTEHVYQTDEAYGWD